MTRKRLFLTGLAVATAGLVSLAGANKALASPHSDYGCVSCHVPHGSAGDQTQVPLWNPAQTSTSLTGYFNDKGGFSHGETFGAPTGASVLCLSCHDGSYSHVTTDHTFGPSGGMGALTQTHPISFKYDATLYAAAIASDGSHELVDPSTLTRGILDGNGEMQCTSCHDPHSSEAAPIVNTTDNSTTDYRLRWTYDNINSTGSKTTAAFCRHCHVR